MALSAWAVLVSLHSVPLAGLAVGVLLISTASFWLPTRYVIDDDGVSVSRISGYHRRRWRDLRRYSFGSRTVLLSPFAKPHRLDRFRGVVILLDGAPIDALRALFATRLDGPRQTSQLQKP
jgi:hypothetical protein